MFICCKRLLYGLMCCHLLKIGTPHDSDMCIKSGVLAKRYRDVNGEVWEKWFADSAYAHFAG